MEFAVERVSTIILRVADLERSTAFYRDTIGLPLRFGNGAFSFFDGGGVDLVLNRDGDPAAVSSTTEVVLEVDDVMAAHLALTRRGVSFRVAPRPVTEDADRQLLAADFRDPDGHLLSITGWVPRKG